MKRIFTVFVDIIRCFLISCGLAGIIFFFNQNGDPAFMDPMIYQRLVYLINYPSHTCDFSHELDGYFLYL